jgi:aquaporin Z
MMSTSSNLLDAADRTAVVKAAPVLTLREALRHHWPEYLMEAALLGAFMISACSFGILYEHPNSPIRQAIGSAFMRRVLMGASMGITALAIIYSPWGRQSGAHINPAVTLTFFRLGKLKLWDLVFYASAQFGGAAIGVFLVHSAARTLLAHPAVHYVTTVPGAHGAVVALTAEFVIAFVLMTTILHASNDVRFNRYTGVFAALLVTLYISFEAPLSGMSMNPARTAGSAIPSGMWSSFWIYVVAPVSAMLTAAEVYLWRAGRSAVKCCKLHHQNTKRCIFCGANGGFSTHAAL